MYTNATHLLITLQHTLSNLVYQEDTAYHIDSIQYTSVLDAAICRHQQVEDLKLRIAWGSIHLTHVLRALFHPQTWTSVTLLRPLAWVFPCANYNPVPAFCLLLLLGHPDSGGKLSEIGWKVPGIVWLASIVDMSVAALASITPV
jgi:hypothetical protein